MKIVYAHSDNGRFHTLYVNNKLVCWDEYYTQIPSILKGLEISYYDYQISDEVCKPSFGCSGWNPPDSLSFLHFCNRAERASEYRKQKAAGSFVDPKDFAHLNFIGERNENNFDYKR